MIWVALLVTWVLARLCANLVADLPDPPPAAEPDDRRAEIDGENVFYF
jgi:hypothetical protein